MDKAVIFFRGIPKNGEAIGQIDEAAATLLSHNRGAEPLFFNFEDWPDAAVNVASFPKRPYYLCGFSRGAAGDIMGGFMTKVRARNLRQPEDMITAGLYGPTHRYVDPVYECLNFLDASGQAHVGEHNAINLGPHVEHLDPANGTMATLARMYAPASVKPVVLSWQDWPLQSEAQHFYGGSPATPGWEAKNIIEFRPPWPLDPAKSYGLDHIRVHRFVVPSLTRVCAATWDNCAKSIDVIRALRYDRCSGGFVDRLIRGGKSPSMHSLGAAIDWDDLDNPQHDLHTLFNDKSILIQAFKYEGWEYGGDWSPASRDSMHCQASRTREALVA